MFKFSCNLDWLEVFCLEPINFNVIAALEYFNYDFKLRPYGTPIYRDVVTVYIGSLECFEIRCHPYSSILDKRSAHIKLCNRFCYYEKSVEFLLEFINCFGYEFKNISRIDLALDFNCFANGASVSTFIQRYLNNTYAKINQSRVGIHGKDTFDDKVWNSLKWGSESSEVTTKLYNKTLEMKETKRKFYIIDTWKQNGLDLEKDVWRIEFSLKSGYKIAVPNYDEGYIDILDNNINWYIDNSNKLRMWKVLYKKYFDFRRTQYTNRGTKQRKDRCKRVELFNLDDLKKSTYLTRITRKTDVNRTDKILYNRLRHIYDCNAESVSIRNACCELMQYFHTHRRYGRDISF